MTRTYCDICGVDTTRNQYRVIHPNPYHKKHFDTCQSCSLLVIETVEALFPLSARTEK